MQLRQVGVCLVTNCNVLPAGRGLVETVHAALDGGLRCVQFRDLELAEDQAVALMQKIAMLCHEAGALYLINGRPDRVVALGATGLHVGRGWCDDVAGGVARARSQLPANTLIGASVHTVAEAIVAAEAGADYLIVGTMYPTPSKPNLIQTAGPALIRTVRAALGVDMPLLAIGGITAANLGPVRLAGADGICVMRAILGAADPTAATLALLQAWRTALLSEEER